MDERIKFYGRSDLCYGMHMDKIVALEIPVIESVCINDAIEFYQIKLYFDDGLRSKDWDDAEYDTYLQKQQYLFSLTMRFFNSLNDNNIVKEYEKVDIDYKEAFWELFDRCKLYNEISADVFNNILHSKYVAPNHIFERKDIVKTYGEVLREYIKQNLFMVKILIDAYEQDYREVNKLYLPQELTGDEICACFDSYIESNQAEFYSLESIFQMKCKDRFPVTDELRLKAKRRYEEKAKEIRETGVTFKYGAEIVFSPEQEEIKKFDFKDNITIASYSTQWLMKTLEYGSILNNFIHLFEYVDNKQMRCNLVSKESKTGVFERVLSNRRLSCYYPDNNVVFTTTNSLAILQMTAYYKFLKEQGILYENVLQWFFTKYLQETFNCPEIRVRFPSSGSTFEEKCTSICATFDSLLKQYNLWIKNNEIDFELVAISSGSIKFDQIPSAIDDKYIYGKGKDFEWLKSTLFSDQCTFSFVKRISDEGKTYDTFYELLRNEDVYLSDYSEWEQPAILRLADNDLITVSETGELALGDKRKLIILRDIFDNEVISRYRYSPEANEIFEQWISEGMLESEGGLFSRQEVDYFNYLLNRVEYVNGLDLRNRYLHGIQQVNLDETAHEQNYYTLLIVLTVLALKINDDFILKTVKERKSNDTNFIAGGPMQ